MSQPPSRLHLDFAFPAPNAPCHISLRECESCFGLLSEPVSCWTDIFGVAYCWAWGVSEWRKSLSVFNHYFHIKCTPCARSSSPPCSPSHAHTTSSVQVCMNTHTLSHRHTHTYAQTCTDTWSWQSSCHYWSRVRWGHGRMTAVTESPLPPRSRELKTNKPAARGKGGEIVCVHRVCPCVAAAELQYE